MLIIGNSHAVPLYDVGLEPAAALKTHGWLRAYIFHHGGDVATFTYSPYPFSLHRVGYST